MSESALHADDEQRLHDAVLSALNRALNVPHGVYFSSDDGIVTLSGHVTWSHQRNAAERAVTRVQGVVHVVNRLIVRPAVSDETLRSAVLAALQRRLGPDAAHVRVELVGRIVTLSGHARSWRTIDLVSDTVRSVTGIQEVIDCVHMRPEVDDHA